MKKYLPIVLVIAVLIGVGFFAYNLYYKYYVPKGDLKIIVTNNGQPVKNLEIDVAENPGQPQQRDETDKNGVVLFESLPIGSYAIYFNLGNFPANLAFPHEILRATVKQNQVKEKEIELRSK